MKPLRILTGIKYPKIKLQYEYRHLGSWYIKGSQVIILKQNFQKVKVVTGKTPFFVIDLFVLPILFVLILASERAV